MPEDWGKVNGTARKQLFFGRKFEPVISQSVLDQVDLWINANNVEDQMYRNRAQVANWEHPSRTRYWQNIYHHLDASPKPDQAIVEMGKILCEMTKERIIELSQYRFNEIHEITSYHNDDTVQGILLKFDMKDAKGQKQKFELLVKLKNNMIEKQITFRQGEFKIGTNFDPKEFVFRNFLYAMNEASKPALMYSFESAQEEDEHGFVMKVVWVNPNGDVDYVAEESLSNNSINKDTIKPDFKTPVMSGIWTVMVLNAQNNELLARIPFLIIPTENAIETVSVSNNNNNNKEERQSLAKLFRQTQSEEDKRLFELNHHCSKQNNKDKKLCQKILVTEFYVLESICHANSMEAKEDNHQKPSKHNIPLCEETLWSSLSPDPKSEISKFNEETETLV